MFDWMSRTGSCGVGSPNSGTAANRYYDCRKPELSIVLRTNCQSSLQAGPPGRCQYECQDTSTTVPVALEDTLASDKTWNTYFGSREEIVNNQDVTVPLVTRLPGTALYARSPSCDEVWTIGHGRPWHTDTRETRLYQSAAINADTGLFESFKDVKAIRYGAGPLTGVRFCHCVGPLHGSWRAQPCPRAVHVRLAAAQVSDARRQALPADQ